MRDRIVLAIGVALLVVGCSAPIRQLVVVTPDEVNSSKGTLSLWEHDGAWQKEFEFGVVLGRNGVAAKGEKREGDGKTPSGLFALGPLFAATPIEGVVMKQFVTEGRLCIDDPLSPDYNQIVAANKENYASYEEMARPDGLYDIGAVINYNEERIPMKGSCIFLHIARSDGTPTAGCVAASKERLLLLFRRLNPQANPHIWIGLAAEADSVRGRLK
ncbi:MAG: hypothetical protein K6347_01045 [Campylobacterales bacterium]